MHVPHSKGESSVASPGRKNAMRSNRAEWCRFRSWQVEELGPRVEHLCPSQEPSKGERRRPLEITAQKIRIHSSLQGVVEEDDRLARVVPLKMAFPEDNMEIISREDKGRACVAMQSGLVPTPPLCSSCGCVI